MPVAFIKSVPSISFDSHNFWRNRKIEISKTGGTQNENATFHVYNICLPSNIDTAEIKITDYKNIREIIQQKKKKVFDVTGNKDRFVLIIKPSDKASFKNFVDLTDEVTINQIKRYYIDELNEEEKIKIKRFEK